jgi:hypothetical protein
MINRAVVIGITFVGASELIENQRWKGVEVLLNIKFFGKEYLKFTFLVIVLK